MLNLLWSQKRLLKRSLCVLGSGLLLLPSALLLLVKLYLLHLPAPECFKDRLLDTCLARRETCRKIAGQLKSAFHG